MYHSTDPRAALAASTAGAKTAATHFAGAEYAKFYEQKPDEIMAAISERCHQAAANQETISQKMTQSITRGMRV